MKASIVLRTALSGIDAGEHARLAFGLVAALTCLPLVLAACGTPPQTSAVSRGTPAPRGTATAAAAATITPLSIPWIPIASQAPADVLSAVRQAPFLQTVSSAPVGSDGYTDVSRLGTPVLVIAYGGQSGSGAGHTPDYYEIPVLSPAGMVTDTISAQLNAAHTAIYVGSISGAAPTSHWPAKLVDASQAAQIVKAQLHVQPRARTHPELIYLAAYNTSAVETGQLAWSAGGAGPMNPIWLVPGADDHDYFVGTDGQAYSLAQLPVQR